MCLKFNQHSYPQAGGTKKKTLSDNAFIVFFEKLLERLFLFRRCESTA